MIPKETIDKIFDTADIVEVISDFVQLKKSGSNYKGLSPFVDEKSPSFMVSPAKGIFKDFSSGKGGTAVTFLMEHEHFTYPEALRWLADKYKIEIEEEDRSVANIAAQNTREGLYLVNQFAKDYFVRQLQTNEGKAIGLSYFKERGFSEATIQKFELGYSPDHAAALTDEAVSAGYKLEYLEKTGLSKTNDKGSFDFFRGRVIFPIHNLTGRILGFGGRTLRTDKKTAKYFNSPESEVYNKSKVLYGLFQSKNAIIKSESCYLVEGYTDVISLHQAGIENVVASSGTALTEGQIRLIQRYAKNIVILYDGDAAGIKASFRGIDLILKEGLNVKVVLFPDGDDPDSYSRKVSLAELSDYLERQAQDFIAFKAGILLDEAKGDPIKKADTIRAIVESIAVIPNEIVRSVYVQETSQRFDISEKALLNEVAKILSKSENLPEVVATPTLPVPSKKIDNKRHNLEVQERDLVRLMLEYGSKAIETKLEDGTVGNIPLAQFVIEELVTDDIQYSTAVYQRIFEEFLEGYEKGFILNPKHFIHTEFSEHGQVVTDLLTQRDYVSKNWEEKHQIIPRLEENQLKRSAEEAVFMYKLRLTENMIFERQEKLKAENIGDEVFSLLEEIKELSGIRNIFANQLGIIITR